LVRRASEQCGEPVTLSGGQRWRGIDESPDVFFEFGGAQVTAQLG
jgi:hypothetical protein